MPTTIGYHWVKSAYGLWLPGDERGHWSEAWDETLGLIEPRTLHAGDPVRRRIAEERMKHPPTRLDPSMIRVIIETVVRCADDSDWNIAAISVEPTHMHVLMTRTAGDIDRTVKWLADQTTKAVHRHTDHTGPVWSRGRWLQFIDDRSHWDNLMRYINRHGGSQPTVASPQHPQSRDRWSRFP